MQIVLCYIVYNGKVLLLKRNNDPYKGLWAFPGGKVEENEDVLVAARREAAEETALTFSDFQILGSAREDIIDRYTGKVLYSYDMSLVKLIPSDSSFMISVEGELRWLDIANFRSSANIVPTDIDMFEKFCMSKCLDSFYYRVIYDRAKGYSILNIDKIIRF